MRMGFGEKTGAGHGKGWRIQPSYDFYDWSLKVDQADTLSYRPGVKCVAMRMLFAGCMACVAMFVYYGYVKEQQAREHRVQRAAARAQELLGAGLAAPGHAQIAGRNTGGQDTQEGTPVMFWDPAFRHMQWGLAGFIAAMLLIPLSAAWNRLSLSVSPRRELVVSSWVLFPKSIRIPWEELGAIQYGAQEIIHRRKGNPLTTHYWQWFVRLQPKIPGAPWLVNFYPYRQKERPSAQPRAPQRVARMIEWCRAHAPLRISGPFFHEQSAQRGLFRRAPGHTAHTPIIRQVAPDAIAENITSGPGLQVRRELSRHIAYENEQGVRHSAQSFDELPPHIRARIPRDLDNLQRQGISQRIVIRGPDGRETLYNSLEEVPPEIRQRIEALRRGGQGPI